ncbi:MAG TPA: hypothetical protein VMM12_06665 [Longimicrobiales bacterium]|nr:hypothetical protein [Longimicrobiales bacterium]
MTRIRVRVTGDPWPEYEERLHAVCQRIVASRGRHPSITEGVTAVALKLLERFLGVDPEALIRASGPEAIAAGAVHAALRWRFTPGRKPSAAEVARWYGVSAASVSARSLELRRTVERAGTSAQAIQRAAWEARGGPRAEQEVGDLAFLLERLARRR